MKLIAVQGPGQGQGQGQGRSTDAKYLDQMFCLRSRVFGDRLAWSVTKTNGRELDEFDGLEPTYILALSQSDDVVGCARLLPSIGPTMLQRVFPQLLSGGSLTAHEKITESSRFCVDTALRQEAGEGGIHAVTLAMFAGILEWCLLKGYTEIVTATDIRLERILRRAGWPMKRLGKPVMIGETMSVAGVLAVDEIHFGALRPATYQSSFEVERQRAL
jgi:acyl homoserine lactone synthase